ncbi:MAG: hypothetical protein LBH06_01940 [Rikenellaceae bacterium]|jgi:hypothetical protein|nr:hypothetical protein [Rikenellaceae bacterium]
MKKLVSLFMIGPAFSACEKRADYSMSDNSARLSQGEGARCYGYIEGKPLLLVDACRGGEIRFQRQ